ncbi:MAG TPA: hypothetical protein VL981_08280 [Candidatus Methylacidiphilales bacterium]|nr:hypothetical protein [Candidatus Methylacidiphilales bacterium]
MIDTQPYLIMKAWLRRKWLLIAGGLVLIAGLVLAHYYFLWVLLRSTEWRSVKELVMTTKSDHGPGERYLHALISIGENKYGRFVQISLQIEPPASDDASRCYAWVVSEGGDVVPLLFKFHGISIFETLGPPTPIASYDFLYGPLPEKYSSAVVVEWHDKYEVVPLNFH